MNQKEIKAIKKEVQKESAMNIGYYTSIVGDIITELGDDFLTRILGSELGEEIVEQAKNGQNAEAMNIFVTEAVRQMTYSEFKLIAHNFFSYRQENNEIISKAIEPTEGLHQNLAAEEALGREIRGTMQKGKEFKKNKKIFTPEEFEKIIKETPFYSSLEESEFSSLQYLSDEQLKEVLEYQERQLQDTREGIDQAAYEIVEDGADISDIDDWVKDFKVGMSNLRKILSEQLIRSEREQEKNKQEKVEQNTTRSLKI